MLHATDRLDDLPNETLRYQTIPVSLGNGCLAEVDSIRFGDTDPQVVLRAAEWPMNPDSARLLASMLVLAADRADELGTR